MDKPHIQQQDIRTLKEFYDLMDRTRSLRFDVVSDVFGEREADGGAVASLKNALASLNAVPAKGDKQVLLLDATKTIEVDLAYEIAELEKDPLYAINPVQNPQGRIAGERPNPMGFEVDPGDADSRYLEITSSSSRAGARGMGAIMGMLSNGGSLDGTSIISSEGIEEAIGNPVRASDRPNGRFGMAESIFVQGGWGVTGRDTYGWGGAGGSVIQFSPVKRVGFGYSCTGFADGLSGDQDRVGPLVQALLDALNAR